MDETEQSGEARFDSALGAWVLTSYADVSAALRDPRLSVPGTNAAGDAAHVVGAKQPLTRCLRHGWPPGGPTSRQPPAS